MTATACSCRSATSRPIPRSACCSSISSNLGGCACRGGGTSGRVLDPGQRRLDHLEALERRMACRERGALASVAMGEPEGVRLGPGLEIALAAPDHMRGIERVVLALRPAQQVELDEAGH